MSKRDVTGGQGLGLNAFGSLNLGGLPDAPAPKVSEVPLQKKPSPKGKVHLRIEKSGRSGKVVTVLFGPGVEQLVEADREGLLKSLKAGLGSGGVVVDATLELQGDVRERVTTKLRELGYPMK